MVIDKNMQQKDITMVLLTYSLHKLTTWSRVCLAAGDVGTKQERGHIRETVVLHFAGFTFWRLRTPAAGRMRDADGKIIVL